MSRQPQALKDPRVDVCSLEADLAFFQARLSLAGDAPDTVYQRAQIKTYKALGILLGRTLDQLRTERKATPSKNQRGGAAA